MPELPEVEVTRATLAGRLCGATLRWVRLGKPLRWPLGCEPSILVGLRAGELQRRGKYLWLPLAPAAMPCDVHDPSRAPSATAHAGGLLMHLGMSGSLNFSLAPPPPGPHDHVDLAFDQGVLRLTDPRRFGAVVWSDALHRPPASRLLERLGLEPFDPRLTAQALHQALASRRTPIKVALMAGDIVVGAGNIYASEILFQAGIDPRTPAQRIGLRRCERLLVALRQVLARAIELGGSTLRDFHDAHGVDGAFQDEAQVYGREGQVCRRCGARVRRIVQAQRSTFYCPACQRW